MSDYLIIRSVKPKAASSALVDWAKSQRWARHAEIRQSWEPFEAFINGHNAVKFMKGKHKQDLAELVLFTKKLGISVIHVQLRDDQRLEQSQRVGRPYNQPLLWTGLRRGVSSFTVSRSSARRVVGRRMLSVMRCSRWLHLMSCHILRLLNDSFSFVGSWDFPFLQV